MGTPIVKIKTLQDSLRKQAGIIWHSQADARRHSLWLNEETITESVLLQLCVRHGQQGLIIKAFKKAEETQNGADWEWVFSNGKTGTRFRVQAKRLTSLGRYGSLKPNGSQIRTLISRSIKEGCHPCYVFYNGADLVPRSNGVSLLKNHGSCGKFRGPSYWGCSISDAYVVQRVNSDKMANLLPVMKPWHCLLSNGSTNSADLAEIVALNFSSLCEEKSMTAFKPTSLPHWINLLRSADATQVNMLEYLEEHNLQGVAMIEIRP